MTKPIPISERELGDLLRYKREAAGVTRERAALWIGRHPSTLRRWEHGVGLAAPRDYFCLLELLGYEIVIRPRTLDPDEQAETA